MFVISNLLCIRDELYGLLIKSCQGWIKFADDCLTISNSMKPVCIRTLSPDALVSLGVHAGLKGTAIQCVKRVDIGRLSNIADVYITDTPAHSLGKHRRLETVEDLDVYKRQGIGNRDTALASGFPGRTGRIA